MQKYKQARGTSLSLTMFLITTDHYQSLSWLSLQQYCYIIFVYVCMSVFVDVSIDIVSFIFVCMWFVYALVWKNSIVQAPEFKLLINQSINQSEGQWSLL